MRQMARFLMVGMIRAHVSGPYLAVVLVERDVPYSVKSVLDFPVTAIEIEDRSARASRLAMPKATSPRHLPFFRNVVVRSIRKTLSLWGKTAILWSH